jgi:hypothetical protein
MMLETLGKSGPHGYKAPDITLLMKQHGLNYRQALLRRKIAHIEDAAVRRVILSKGPAFHSFPRRTGASQVRSGPIVITRAVAFEAAIRLQHLTGEPCVISPDGYGWTVMRRATPDKWLAAW